MNLELYKPEPEKWLEFYKTLMHKPMRAPQRGRGGTLIPRTKGSTGSIRVNDVIGGKQLVVSPTEQVVKQIKSELKNRKTKLKGNRTPVASFITSAASKRKASTLSPITRKKTKKPKTAPKKNRIIKKNRKKKRNKHKVSKSRTTDILDHV